MTPDQWKDLLDFGLPTAALVAIALAMYRAVKWIGTNWIHPILGPEGVISRYFSKQEEQYERQGDIAEKHQQLTEELAKSCSVHHHASDDFFRRSDVSMAEIIQVHSHIVTAMKCQFSEEKAIEELTEADAILRRHMCG